MKLYNRKLNGLADLRREKDKLEVEKKFTSAKDLMPVKELNAGSMGLLSSVFSGARKSKNKGWINTGMDLMNAKNNVERAVILAPQLISSLTGTVKKKKKNLTLPLSVVSHKPSRVKTIAKDVALEFVGGYLKWKALEMSYRGIKLLIKWQKTKREREIRRGK